ncbi:hypothetical protein HaLaN_21830, partial [Haematococcus lacustris]
MSPGGGAGGRRGMRADLGAAQHRPLGPLPPTMSEGLPPPVEGEGGEGAPDNTFIWGTSVSVAAITHAARRFLGTFMQQGSTDPRP